MTNMQDREKAFEAKFALDEELRFKAEARRNKLLGFWAAGLLGKSDAAGIVKTDEEIRLKMLELLSEAVTQIQNG